MGNHHSDSVGCCLWKGFTVNASPSMFKVVPAGRFGLVFLITCFIAGCSHATSRTSLQQPATVRLMIIGNSFSQQGSSYLPRMAKAAGHTLIVGRAELGGCTLERHWNAAEAYETNPEDPEGKPYKLRQPDGTTRNHSLRELLESKPWDYVTLQQASGKSADYETYQPYASQLAAYIAKCAPQARLVIHETWSYREDDPVYEENGLNAEAMYARVRENYARMAAELGAVKMIRSGTAMQAARRDPRWRFEAPANLVGFWYPHLPPQKHSLNVGYHWDAKKTPPMFKYDGHHLSTPGRYLISAVWYETFFGDVRESPIIPPNMTAKQAASLKEIAHAAAQ